MPHAGPSRRAPRARAPRVDITFDQEVDGETRRRELPFVIGVLGDFVGTPEPRPPKLGDRKFVDVEAGTFDTVMRSTGARLNVRVPNRLANDGSLLEVRLRFEHLADFEPEVVANQVEPLRQLMALRRDLSLLRAALHRSPEQVAQLLDGRAGPAPGPGTDAEQSSPGDDATDTGGGQT